MSTPNDGHGDHEHQHHAGEPGQHRPGQPRAEVDRHRQRRAAHALEQPLVARGGDAEDDARVAGQREAEDADRRRVELRERHVAAAVPGAATMASPLSAPKMQQEHQREREGEERHARDAQHQHDARGDPAAQQRCGRDGSCGLLGQLQVDVLERRAADGQPLELDSRGRPPTRAAGRGRAWAWRCGSSTSARARRPPPGRSAGSIPARQPEGHERRLGGRRPARRACPRRSRGRRRSRPRGRRAAAPPPCSAWSAGSSCRARAGRRSAPTTGGARRDRSRWSARRGRAAPGRRRCRARGRAAAAGRRRACSCARAASRLRPTSSATSSAGSGLG